jgi:hypothetical protein
MASITWWNRLEPRPRASQVAETLAAEVRDPLWFLARQWQLGEFRGEDAGSPAVVRLTTRLTRPAAWAAQGGDVALGTGPLEPVVLGEAFGADLATRVELGHTFLALLRDRYAPDPVPEAVVTAIRTAFPLRPWTAVRIVGRLLEVTDAALAADVAAGGLPSAALIEAFAAAGAELDVDSPVLGLAAGRVLVTDALRGDRWVVTVAGDVVTADVAVVPDEEAAAFALVCAGRAVDGVATLAAAPGAAPLTTPEAVAAVADLRQWVARGFGAVSAEPAPPAAWSADELRYDVRLRAADGDGGRLVLSARPDADGDLDWYAFDVVGTPAGGGGPVTTATTSALPAHVRFRGMPNARWWDFENAGTDFGAVVPDRRDLAKLVVVDFMLVHGNDWFLLPYQQPVGTLCTVASLLVYDVFGDAFLVPRADAKPADPPPGERWSMFSTTTADGPAGFFLLPPTVGTAGLPSEALERVRFGRDETANLVWAVEQVTENGVGAPWPGHEREQAVRAAVPEEPASPDASLRYRLMTPTPEHWVPFVPAVADADRGRVTLQRAAMPTAAGGLTEPAGRLLRGTGEVREEDLPRTGLAVTRIAVRARTSDGGTLLWLVRRVTPGTGEAMSGLAFDQVE